ncbi:MAG: hypothetical protein MZV64_11215 [Ignavibacteriales bacterium]|nr:hypothetical protein [Ignavibacteriales bacterium]
MFGLGLRLNGGRRRRPSLRQFLILPMRSRKTNRTPRISRDPSQSIPKPRAAMSRAPEDVDDRVQGRIGDERVDVDPGIEKGRAEDPDDQDRRRSAIRPGSG